MQIADLPIPQLIDLSDGDQLKLILAIRDRRRFTVKVKKVSEAKAQRRSRNPLATMTREQLEKLLGELTK